MPEPAAVGEPRAEAPRDESRRPMATRQAPFASSERLEIAKEFVRSLAVAHTNAGLYPVTHPLVERSLDDLVSAVDAVIRLGFDSVTLNIYKDTLFVENQVFPEESVTYRRLAEEFLARGVSAVTFGASASKSDTAELTGLLLDASIADIDAAQCYLRDRGVTTIELAETSAFDASGSDDERLRAKAAARADYDAGVAALHDVEMEAKLGRVFEIGPLQRIVASLLETLLRDPAAVLGLTAIRGHDEYTLNHSINVCILALSLGAAVNLDDEALRSLGLSALLYDIGKVRVPVGILSKRGPLTGEEWEIVKSHSEEGADLLKRVQLVDHMPMVVAYEHHQRHDLRGYPESKDGREQHLFSKIVAICDAYDAMTTRRPFRREIRPDKALAVLMQGRGKSFDPDIVKTFVALLGIYPMGAVVILDDGGTAVVYRVNSDDLLHPRVKVLADSSGRWLEQPETVDLRVVNPQTASFVHSIVECVPAIDAGVDDVWQYL